MNVIVLLFSEFSAAKVSQAYYKRFKQIFHFCYNLRPGANPDPAFPADWDISPSSKLEG